MTHRASWLLAALVLPGIPCGLLDIHGQSVTGTGHLVVTSFDVDAPAILECRAQLAEWPAARMTLDYASTGVQCGTGRDTSTNWVETISQTGKALLRCKLPVRP